jgi:putative transposase
MDEPYLLATARYIELNPVRARLVPNPFSYPWSSAAAHAKGENDGLVRVEPLLGMAGDWRQFLADGIEDEKLVLVRRHERTGRPLGSDGFIENLEERLEKSLKPQKRGPRSNARSHN